MNYIKTYESFYSGTHATVYLKPIRETEKAMLYGFQFKNVEESIWIPKKAIYNTLKNDININKEYKILVIGSFIIDENEEFFELYTKYMIPAIDKKKLELLNILNDETIERFKHIIVNMIPGINNFTFNNETGSIDTNKGSFKILKKDPIEFTIGKVIINSHNGLITIRINDTILEIKGKNGLVAKAFIKYNTKQRLNAVELMAIQTIYNNYNKNHNSHYRMASSNYKQDLKKDKLIGEISKILKKYNRI